ncbi:hypothetical protein C2G38_2122115 [Gigaspora rosea]|uniref:Uncharacterized protein n=1 Tax=Gigaspora rosea TaxID=44941 RepID=A0A397U3Z0_9GLOM|nr:hypothetical protein C2G38_2122115 [Gigaspora rosea]
MVISFLAIVSLPFLSSKLLLFLDSLVDFRLLQGIFLFFYLFQFVCYLIFDFVSGSQKI